MTEKNSITAEQLIQLSWNTGYDKVHDEHKNGNGLYFLAFDSDGIGYYKMWASTAKIFYFSDSVCDPEEIDLPVYNDHITLLNTLIHMFK